MSKDKPQAGQIVRKLIVLAVLAVVSAGVIFLLDAGRVLRPLQHMAYDGLVYLRAKTGLEPDRPASPVVIVKIDDRTFADKDFRLPQTLWHNYFSTVIQGLAMGGAKTIGLDKGPDQRYKIILPGTRL